MTISTILYIEDDALNRRLVTRILEPLGYRVLLAEDGMSGIETAQRERPDLILMDINLPDIDGLGATVKLRSIPDLAHVPIIAVTAGGFDRARERSLTMGCTGFITKPIDINTFPDRIRAFLGGYRESAVPTVGKDTAAMFIRDESLVLVSRLEDKIHELTAAKRELEEANQSLAAAFDELKRAHETEKRLHKAKTDFIAVSSHELRTPLAVISGYVDLLVGGHAGPLPKEMDRILRISQRNSLRLASIVAALSDVARLEAVGLDLRLEPHGLEATLRDLLEDLAPALSMRRLEANLEVTPRAAPVLGDKERLFALFHSLLMNAIRFTPDGGHIGIMLDGLDGATVVAIRDSGIGIARDDLERIFEPFFRVQDSLHHSSGTFEFQSGGIGLGLTLARGIVEAHGGRIQAESEGLGKGSTFVVRLPAARF